MFERYTEKARRVIFFARYEASQFGSPYIRPSTCCLPAARGQGLTNRFLRSHASVESIRKQIEAHTTIREKVSTRSTCRFPMNASACCVCGGEASAGAKHIGQSFAARFTARRKMLCRRDPARARPELAQIRDELRG